MKRMVKMSAGKGNVFLVFAVILLSLSLLPANSQAATTYFSIRPGKEVCTTIVFGQNGRGEYVLTAEEPATGPWIDNHFTSFTAGPENIIMVPICLSAKGRALSANGNIRVVLTTPMGNVTHDYGVCVSNYEDVDVVEGSATGNACERMASHTDIFSASLTQPEMYASPGEAVTFTMVLDSTIPLTLEIARGSEMQIRASQTTVEAGAGQQSVSLQLVAPNSAGDYDFIVQVSAQGCSLADCSRSVRGVLHVGGVQDRPQASFYVWLTPETKSIMGQQSTMYVMRFENYGNGQELTATVSLDAGLESDFAPYSAFLAKDDSRSISFTARPATADRKTYKLTATVTGKDGTDRSIDAWLTVDEMVADAAKLNQSGFIANYDANDGAGLADWEELRSVTGPTGDGGNGGDNVEPDQNPLLFVTIAVVIAVIIVLFFIIYRKTSAGGGGELTWKSLGI